MNSDNSIILNINNVCLSYGERHVLCHIKECLRSTDFVVLSGPNGGGKTTLLRLIAGLLPPTRGKIERKPHVVVGYLPQYRHIDRQFPTTVADIVLSGLACRRRCGHGTALPPAAPVRTSGIYLWGRRGRHRPCSARSPRRRTPRTPPASGQYLRQTLRKGAAPSPQSGQAGVQTPLPRSGCNYSPLRTMRRRHRPVLTFSHILPAYSLHYSTVCAKVGKLFRKNFVLHIRNDFGAPFRAPGQQIFNFL